MKKLRRLVALLLCIFMMFPAQGLTALAEAEGQAMTSPLEDEIEEAEEIERIEETMALEPIKNDTIDEGIIYWNPGGVLPENLATASNAQVATVSNAKKGNDHADGLTPSTPVKTLAKALERAEELMTEEGLLPTDIIIYAMNPMEVADGQLYALNGGNLMIKSWPGRSYDSDVIFYVNGGQLTMVNVKLASGNPERAGDEARLIYVRGGAFQMGQNVTLEGRVVLDYRSEIEETAWEMATASDGSRAAAGEGSFDISEYILDSDEDSMELIEDRISASTWRDPIIELLEGFRDGGAGEYLIELLADGSEKEIELVKTLYSDGETEEEFLGLFMLVENTGASWSLQVETQAVAQVRNTGLFSTLSEAEVLTSKTLLAARAGSSGKVIYWNPGGDITIGTTVYFAGNDTLFTGTNALYPVKTWEKAVEYAEGGTIFCMQTLDLGNSTAGDYLKTTDSDGNYVLKSSSTATMAALSAWSPNPQPAISVPVGKTLVLQDVELVGVNGTSAPAIACDKGTIIIQKNVTAEIGYIQLTAFRGMEANPVKVTSTDEDYDGTVTLFFSGINNSYDYCYTDVVVPHGDLQERIDAIVDPDDAAIEAHEVGLELLDRFQIHPNHRDEVNGGTSRFDWGLRQDTTEDDGIAKAQNLELYAIYYFDAIYLNGVNGDDSYYGATCQYPLKTWLRAQERWAFEMKKSVDARWAASAAGKSAAYIDEYYPLPKTIYICGTVTVDDSEAWDLWDQYLDLNPSHVVDYDGSTIVTEVIPHMDIPYQEDGATLNHEIPEILVKVIAGGDLRINDITFRNMTDDADSVTIQVEGTGAKLTLKGQTLLTGERLAKGSVTAKAVTLGTHVKVISGGNFVMAADWEGAIKKRQHGVNASGDGTEVTMNGGSIQENNSFETDIYNANLTTHKPGAGVLLSDQARFTMNGGKITKNTVYQYGAGVYMIGTGTTFIMNKGEISGNKMNGRYLYGSTTTLVNGMGIGIYAGIGTKLTLGRVDGGNSPSDVLITNNMGYWTAGVGVWSNGELNINKATISENYTDGVNSTQVSYGIGIYVGANTTLNMDGGQIIGNYTYRSSYGSAQGAGVYLASSTDLKSHSIASSSILNNIVGSEYTNTADYSAGGGIYMDGSNYNLSITDSLISGNQAYGGGGIYISASSTATAVTIKNTTIQENKGTGTRLSSYGYGGGIYFTGYGSLTLLDGVEISNNSARQTGGGIYLTGGSYSNTHLYMMSDTSGAIRINGNEAVTGGGIYHTTSTIHAKNAEINGNRATTGAGIYTNSYGYFKAVEIDGNQATTGAGLYLMGTYYMNDCVVTDNTAQGFGGGIYVLSGTLHLTESSSGGFELHGNRAADGGGIYVVTGTFMMNIAGEIQNSAENQGSNLYLCAGNSYILEGDFKQPEMEDRIPGVYNIYVNNTETDSTRKYFDMQSVTVEKKDEDDPEVIYLNTTDSYLTYLNSPPDNIDKAFPIDLNKEVFKVGSVVIKPAYTALVGVYPPNDDLTAVDTSAGAKTYTLLVNAAVNMEYSSGGKLPRRTWLGGFPDSTYLARTNVTLIAEGVYLSGGGNDSWSGADPDHAVKTFAVAKEILQKMIEDTADDEALLPEEEREGFAPFIYICGQVDIVSGESDWELDYDEALFTDTNEYYTKAEERNLDVAYPAQVRRFASFAKAPMIQVRAGLTFETQKIIIDGMAEAVVRYDQSTSSPIINSLADSVVILNEKSQIQNNYYNGLDIRGELIVNGSVSGDDDKQIYNHHGSFVRLYGTMSMNGGARIYADDTVKKVGTRATHGIQAMGVSTKITMSDNSAIIHESGDLLAGSAASYGILANQNYSLIEMSGNASIQNHESIMNYGIYIAGTDSVLKMSGTANITGVDASIQYGIYAHGTRTAITMSEYSKIVQSGTRPTSNYGIWQGGTNVVITMQDYASITCAYSGIWMAAGTSPRVEMKDNAQIFNDDTLQTTYGIYVYSSGGVITEPTIVMTENASIHGSETIKMSAAIYAGAYYAITGLVVEMNMNDGADAEDSVRLDNCTIGYCLNEVGGASLSMGKKASITAVTYGYYQSSYSGTTNDFFLLMRENSRIANSTYGMYFYSAILAPVNITLEGNAAIEQNTHGIYENISIGHGLARFNLQMSGSSRISGNSQYGIYLRGYLAFTATRGYYHMITLNDSALIGGNGYTGIYASSPIQLTMNGTSEISGNGSLDYNTSTSANGVYLERYTNSTYYRAGTAKITLNDSASICDNKGGVYVSTISETTYPNYPNTCEIELNGIKEDGSLSSPSIQRNTDAIYLGGQGTLRLKGGAILGDTTYSSSSYVARSLDCYGHLELDGRSTVQGLVYMRNGDRPITMTHKVVDTGTTERYKLHLVEGFIGRIVVKPEKPAGDPVTDVTDVTDQITYFKKVSADGMAAARPLRAESPNIVLGGENNVYLSGSGVDTNSGNSPSTAVRTFARAKQLLADEGYFTDGANIIICNTTVTVLAGDKNWNFGTGGSVTNTRSGDTWKPLVIRDKDFKGILITLSDSTSASYATGATFKDITIDGGSEQGIVLTTSLNDQLLYVGTNKTVTLGEGAVLQNNKAVTTSYSDNSAIGIKVYRGILQIDGGIIRNVVRETSGAFSLYWFASAIVCQSGSSAAPGKIIMNSGQIVDNELNCPNGYTTNARLGTIYLVDSYTSMEMNGGLISNNKVVSRETNPAAASALIINQGNVYINGGIIRGNTGGYGSAIFYNGSTSGTDLVLSGGQITGNTTNATNAPGGSAVGVYSPIYISGNGFQLKGGGTDIQDSIYLFSSSSPIKVSGQIYQTNRRYRVYLNQGTTATQFKKGSVVVQPDGVNVTDVTPYLSYFDIRTTPYVLDRGRIDVAAGVNQSGVVVTGIKESQCLILMKAVYLDSTKTSSGDGLTPAKAVKTFTEAKAIGALADSNGTTDSYNHYIIYVSGKAINTATEGPWSLPKFAYMCRYTGFAVYSDTNGTAITGNRAYYGPLIEPASDLTLTDIAIYGRRAVDTAVTNNGDSLVHIKSGITVSVQDDADGAILADNYNIGAYVGEEGVENLTSRGGAFHVAAGGILQMKGGVIQNTEAASGSAIYLGASVADQTEFGRGRLILSGTPAVSGKVYLGGTGTVTAAYIEPDDSYQPASALQLSIGNDYNGRPVIRYPAGVTPGVEELEYYLFDNAIKAMYDVVNRADPNGNMLELNMREIIYLDGQRGDDANDGSTPAKAYKTLKKVFEAIGNDACKHGIVVFVVDTVEIPGVGGGPAEIEMMNILVKDTNGNNHYEGYYKDLDSGETINILGQVYFKRYAQPKDYTSVLPAYDGFEAPTLEDTLFDVKPGGALTMRGIYLDGHAQDVDNINPTLVADGVVAMSPLVTVRAGGTLKCLLAEGVANSVSTATQFTNNINGNQKDNQIGVMSSAGVSSDIIEGSGAGIELLDGGECYLEYTEFSNLRLGKNVVAGGTDVYSNGKLHVAQKTHFTGTVYLEGFGAADNVPGQDSSRYIDVEKYGDPVQNDFQVLMRDPYMGRTVVCYPDMTGEGVEPLLTEIGYFRLEERVKDYFCLNKRNVAPYIFELQVPVAVYIDGINGDDGTSLENAVGRVAGSTPKTPVQSLKRAFELLSTRGGNTIYVVNTIQISANTEVTGVSYVGGDGTVLLGSTSKVMLTRYIQPDFAVETVNQSEAIAAGYDVPDFTGVLLNVQNGAAASFGSGVYFDGHSEPKIDTGIGEYGRAAIVSGYSKARAPMITVASGGTLTLSEGTTLWDNDNNYADGDIGLYGGLDTKSAQWQDGGAISNSGTVNVKGALFENNKAAKGSVVYQSGIFNIQSKPENLSNHDNAFYLTTVNSGTAAAPVWGTDHVIRTAVAIPDGMIADLAFDVDMDHAVKGRPVVRFTDSSAYSPNADGEHEHFTLGSTVPTELFLVESETDEALLELQNWEILKVEVPTSIYLVMSRKGTNDASTKLRGIMADALADDLFAAPEYMIKNKGSYDAKVSISGFKNQTADVGISTALYPLMNLTETKDLALGQTDLYLAVEGLDTLDADGSGFGMNETSLELYEKAPATTAPAVLGILTSGTTGNFTFKGAVGSGFMEKYLDAGFPIAGSTGAEAQAYMDGTSGTINARAKYLLRYKVEINPSRRESSTTP